MQNGGHLREVFANEGFTVFFWFWLRIILMFLPLCLTVTWSSVGVIPTAIFSAEAAPDTARPATNTLDASTL